MALNKLKLSGLSLIEILFTLAVIAAMLVVSAGIFRKTSIKSNAININDSVQSLMSAMMKYYSVYCQDLSYDSSGNTIILQGSASNVLYNPDSNDNFLDNPSSISNPLNEDGVDSYQMNIMWVANDEHAQWTFNVNTALKVDNTDVFNTYISLIYPSTVDGQNVTWIQTQASNYSPMKKSTEQFSITTTDGTGSSTLDPCAALNAAHLSQGAGPGSAYN